MVPRSKAGQQIIAQASGASKMELKSASERVARLQKPNRDVKLGLRFGLHPQTKQARAPPHAISYCVPALVAVPPSLGHRLRAVLGLSCTAERQDLHG